MAQVFEDRSVALMLIHERLVRMNASFVGTKGLDDRGRVTWLVRTSDALVRTSDAFVSMNASLMRMSDAFVRMKRGTRELLTVGARRSSASEYGSRVGAVRGTGSPFRKDGRSFRDRRWAGRFGEVCMFFRGYSF